MVKKVYLKSLKILSIIKILLNYIITRVKLNSKLSKININILNDSEDF